MTSESALRRKLSTPPRAEALPRLTPERVWRRAFEFGLGRQPGVAVRIAAAERGLVHPPEVAAMVEAGDLALLLDGPDGYGAAIVPRGVLAGLIERQTLGRLLSRPVPDRAVTAVDAALVADPFDGVLAAQETLAAELSGAGIAAGFRYAAPVADPQTLPLSLADAPHDLWRFDLALGEGTARSGVVRLILPRPAPAPAAASSAASHWAGRLEARVLDGRIALDAVLYRTEMEVARLRALAVGDTIRLTRRDLDGVAICAAGGVQVATARLGRAGGVKAVKIGAPVSEIFTLASDPAPDAPASLPDAGEAPP
ncbi:FliM/FliN family flagellar motor C-terminal domain-containing protein [Palleronia sediminis]|nr:FliM/FliN family flagellar motor C-terminal domain-containing protein [Palleronia sediminis]